jgi:hypothetical protein
MLLFDHFLGPNNVGNMASAAKAKLTGTLYNGEKKWFRFGTKIAGHWVIMTTTIAGVKMMAMAYVWIQKGISYFLSACGSNEVSSFLYRSAFEDKFGNLDYKFLPHPQIAHFTFEYLPLILVSTISSGRQFWDSSGNGQRGAAGNTLLWHSYIRHMCCRHAASLPQQKEPSK